MSSAMGYVEEDGSRHHSLVLMRQQWFCRSFSAVREVQT
jgi:hypothetical protein